MAPILTASVRSQDFLMQVQDLVLNQLVHNEDFFSKVLPHLKHSYFESEPARIVFGIIDSFAQEYSNRPTAEAIAIQANQMKIPEGVWSGVVDLVGVVETAAPPQDQKWLLAQTETWMRDRACFNVIMDSVEIYDNPKRKGELGDIPTRMQDALVVGFDDDLGEVYWEMAGEHYDQIHSKQTKIPFRVEILNKITRGGPWRKTLNAINAGINVGKSTSLISLAADYAADGWDVVYFTFEVASHIIRHRMDCAMLGIDFDTLEGRSRHEYVASIDAKARLGTYGQVFIKEFPAGGAHTGHCRAYLKDLMKRRPNVKPTIIMFDYVGEMASERLPFHMMGNTNIYFGSVAREIRALMFEFDAVGWTALQFNREMQNTKDMKLEGQADSITIPKVLDFQLGLSVPDEYAAMDRAFATVMKSRYNNKSKDKNFLIGLDNDKQKLYDVDPNLGTHAAGDLAVNATPDTSQITNGNSIPGAPKTGGSRIVKGRVADGNINDLKI